MTLPVFCLEEFLAEWEFKAPYLLCCSDAESWSLKEILSLADNESLKLWENLRLSYTEVPGLLALREEIAHLYDSNERFAENILCFAGAEEGIYCAVTALLQPNDHAIVITPCYQSLEELPKHAGAKITRIELSEDDGWELDLAKIEESIQDATRMLLINYPHNPTGMRLGWKKLLDLVELARKHQIIVFSDEVYRLLGPHNNGWEPPVAAIYELGISLGVMSKSFGLAGLRVGWLAAQNKQLLKKIESVKHYTSICNSAPAEVLSLIALRARNQILDRNNQIVKENIALLNAFFKKRSKEFSWVQPQGGCVGLVRYHGQDEVERFCQRLLERKGVLLMPGRIYKLHTNHFRIGFGRKNMPEALAHLGQFSDSP